MKCMLLQQCTCVINSDAPGRKYHNIAFYVCRRFWQPIRTDYDSFCIHFKISLVIENWQCLWLVITFSRINLGEWIFAVFILETINMYRSAISLLPSRTGIKDFIKQSCKAFAAKFTTIALKDQGLGLVLLSYLNILSNFISNKIVHICWKKMLSTNIKIVFCLI